MLNWVARMVREHVAHRTLLLDLYCGIGTFGLSQARLFEHIVGVESSKLVLYTCALNRLVRASKISNALIIV